jgi:hypothetical protein
MICPERDGAWLMQDAAEFLVAIRMMWSPDQQTNDGL